MSISIALSPALITYSPFSHSQNQSELTTGGFAHSLYEKANSAYQQGDINTAVIHVKNALQQDSNNLPARLLFGQILLEYGELAAAEDQYRVALSLNADKSIVITPLAQSLLLQSKFSSILADITIGPYPRDINTLVYVYRAKAYSGLANLEEAKFNYQQALVIDEANIDALLGLSTIAKKQNEPIKAKQFLTQAKAIAPDEPYIAFFEGEQLRHDFKLDDALVAYNEAIALKNDYTDARRARATIHLDQNNLALAKADIEFLLAEIPNDPFSQLLHGLYLAKTNQSIEAKNLIAKTSEQFSQLDPETIDQFAPLALVYGYSQFLQGNLQNATTSLNSYLQKNPSSKQAREILAEIAIERKQYDLASDLLQPVAVDQLSNRSAHIMLRSLIETQRYNQALTLIDQLPDSIRQTPAMVNLHAVVLVKSGNAEQAIDLLTQKQSSAQGVAKNQAMLILGYNYLNQTFNQEALAIAQNLESSLVSENKPLTITELNFIGSAYLVNGDDNSAEQYFERALTIDKNDEVVKRNLAQLYLKNSEYAKAQLLIEQMLGLNPNNLNVLPLYGELLKRQNDTLAALAIFEQINQLAPDNLKNKYQLANAYLATNQADKAIDTANDINRLESLSPFALIVKAKANLLKNDNEQAARSLRIAFGLYTEDADKLVEIAKLQLAARDILSVEKSIATISTLDPNHRALHYLKVTLLEATGDVSGALALLQKQKQQTSDYYSIEANLMLKLYQDENALSSARKAYQLSPTIDNHQLMVRCLLLTKDYSGVYKQFEQWLSANPNDWQSWRKLANLYEQHGLSNDAIKSYQQAIEINSKDVFSLNNLANLLIEQEAYAQALNLAQTAHQYAPLEAKINDTYGWALVHNNRAQEAVNYFRESLARDHNNATTRYHLGIALQKLNRRDEALTELYQALSLSPNEDVKALIQQAIDG
ncbi:PEP-CTERM system TPR-repeat protein PrsT [Thalassotalea sp. LPB0316]|uniref:XrtA/PEP-CTERM system TPR-repeat protein PrsT n=1 Tax=Thalassotalea sp. LPB0316 TaxID=2769490 RepID=UPI001867410D|nr:XrtA/PEP-CTERM system TPR-repeat protein PrsT [Thalassotalea sp. LPB0316]QOL25302.1 PEP-CTERM system TPR-repeat protein PrsT [Thalassotalea sp. LPB0316]